jgi:hypothetical protein
MADESGQDLDGESLIEGLEDEFDALNFAYSQRHRGIHYWGTPQPWETGVAEDDGPDASGRTGGPAGYSEAGSEILGQFGQVAVPARKIAPSEIWRYQGKDVELGLLETSGKSFEVATNHINDIRSRLLEQMGVVLASMADTVSRVTAGAEMSAKFLALAHAPMISLAQELRHCWWPFGLERMASMALRIVTELGGEGILVPGSKSVAAILKAKSYVTFADPANGGQAVQMWVSPKMTPVWGRFFDPSTTEVKTAVETAVAARTGGVATLETVTMYVADDLGVEDPQRELQELEDEAEEAAEAAAELLESGEDEESSEAPESEPETENEDE